MSLITMESVSKATMGAGEDLLSVTQFSQILQKNLESNFDHVWIHGELSSVFYATSGHVYATIKDESSQLKVVIYRFVAQKIPFKLYDGLQVNILVQATCYKPRGDLQLIGKLVEPFGFGSLKLAFEQLRKKLHEEGLFDSHHKIPIPTYPRKIGLITSPKGAVLHDMLNILLRRYPVTSVQVYPTAVQGAEAISTLIATLKKAAEEQSCDFYILARGGGSLEDLWCFNDESVVRAVFSFPLPIVSAIGHETDVTLTDLVSDLRAPTPSAAIEQTTPDLMRLLASIDALRQRFVRQKDRIIRDLEQQLDYLGISFSSPLDRYDKKLIDLENRFGFYGNELIRKTLYMNQYCDSLKKQLSPQYRLEILGLHGSKLNQLERLLSRAFFRKYQLTWDVLSLKAERLMKELALIQSQQENSLKKIEKKFEEDWLVSYNKTLNQFDKLTLLFEHLNPAQPYEQGFVKITDLEGKSLINRKDVKPNQRAFLHFEDDTWEIMFVQRKKPHHLE